MLLTVNDKTAHAHLEKLSIRRKIVQRFLLAHSRISYDSEVIDVFRISVRFAERGTPQIPEVDQTVEAMEFEINHNVEEEVRQLSHCQSVQLSNTLRQLNCRGKTYRKSARMPMSHLGQTGQ